MKKILRVCCIVTITAFLVRRTTISTQAVLDCESHIADLRCAEWLLSCKIFIETCIGIK